MFLSNILKRKRPYVRVTSNIVQYDEMGILLRLVVDSDGKQSWVKTKARKDDKVLKWCFDLI